MGPLVRLDKEYMLSMRVSNRRGDVCIRRIGPHHIRPERQETGDVSSVELHNSDLLAILSDEAVQSPPCDWELVGAPLASEAESRPVEWVLESDHFQLERHGAEVVDPGAAA